MQGIRFDRRRVMRWGMASTSLLLGGRLAAQASGAVDVFGLKLPGEIVDAVLPQEGPLRQARVLSQIAELEQEAQQKALPLSPLSYTDGPAPQVAQTSFYENSMPRLVALIDRSEERDPALADKAASLLSQVNADQHSVPDALKRPEELKLSRGHAFPVLKAEYAKLFSGLQPKSDHTDTIEWHKKMILDSRKRYEGVGDALGIPWYFVGLIHGLEASYNFRAHLHNGDYPLSARTRQVPAGRPIKWAPPSDWESSARDALQLMGFANKPDWSVERTLHRLEAYNGFGYRSVGVPTPYLWSYSNWYESGKFTSDGKWNASAKSRQCGAAVTLKTLTEAGVVALA